MTDKDSLQKKVDDQKKEINQLKVLIQRMDRTLRKMASKQKADAERIRTLQGQVDVIKRKV